MARRLLAAVFAASLLVVSVPAGATASSPHRSGETIGGPLLATSGVVVHPLPGAPSLPAPSALPASSWLVANLTTGQVLAAKAPHERFLPASTLKMLTAVTLLPHLDPTAKVRVSDADVRVDGSRVGLVANMRYTVAKLFTCMLVVSANDAADALADAFGGTKATLHAMNAKARELQAYDTVAKTPSGLDGKGESSSAYDLALIAQAGLAMPDFRHYVGIVRSQVPAPHHKHFAIYTHNRLLTTYRGDIGVKNGYTVAAEGTYVGAATRHGQTILVTLMHANPNFWPMARALLDWGFKANGQVQPVGTLVQPLVPSDPPAQTANVNHAALATTTSHGGSLSTLDVLVIVFTLLVASVTAVRRMRPRRRRSRLRLPPI